MDWLNNLINPPGYWAPLKVIFPVAMVVSGLWIWVDANSRSGNGCFWGLLAFVCPPIGVPFYYISLAVVNSKGPGASARQRSAERREREQERKRLVMMGDIERQREQAEGAGQPGRLFDPAAGMARRSDGCKHFTDEHAESLITAGKHEEAWHYLRDMYELAREEDDGRRKDTYLNYIARLPEGLNRLNRG